MRNDAIRVRNLTKYFGKLLAVDHVGFEVLEGEIFGLLGPNGAGKTTAVRMLTGILRPDSGDVFIHGSRLSENLIGTKMKLGVTPEMGNVYLDLTARQNVILAGKYYGIPGKELRIKAESLLERFGLLEQRNAFVRTLSRGMKQRVNIASALVHSPEILFLDEPTSGLDIQSQRLVRDIIKEMREGGTTVFLTTHNIEEANILCERVAIMNTGRIAAIDTPEKLKSTFEESQSVEVSFNKAIDGSLMEKSGLVSRLEKLGNKWRLYTESPDELVKYLARFAEDEKLKLVSLQTCGASLEDVFVRLTKR